MANSKIGHARLNNLKDVSVTIPKGLLTAVSGVATDAELRVMESHFAEELDELFGPRA